MSTELASVRDRNGEVTLTQFYGGADDGLSLQLTGRELYVSLTKDQAEVLAYALLAWSRGGWPVNPY